MSKKAIIALLLASCVVSVAQTNSNNSGSSSNKGAAFEATGQLMNAVQYGGDAEIVKLLLEKGADINAKDNDGWTPLHHAAKLGDVEIVKLLLERGANISENGNDGGTVLMSAAKRGYLEIAKLLLENGADANAKNNNGYTALMIAALAGQTNVVGILLDKGADIDAKLGDGYTPLMLAVEENQTNAVGLLLDKGANINETNWSGDTVLMTAVEKGKTEIVKLLLARGAKVNAENMLGMSALDEARKNGNAAIVQLLEQVGAKKSSSTIQNEAMSNDLQKLDQSAAVFSNSWKNFQQANATPSSALAKVMNPVVVSGTNTDSSGYVTNVALLTPFTLTNSIGDVITNAILVKLMPSKFIYKTPTGTMGTLRLDSLSTELQERFGYDAATVAAQDAIDASAKVRAAQWQQSQSDLLQQQAESKVQNQAAISFISSSIRAKAEKEWPNDYEMQQYVINQQTEAYNWVVTALSASGVPQDVFDQIRSKATDEWPDDYEMQKYEINQQVKAYIALH